MSDICDDALENLYLYIDGELTPDLTRGIRAHLDDCPPCLDAFSFEIRLKRVVRTRLQEEVPPDLMLRLRAILHDG